VLVAFLACSTPEPAERPSGAEEIAVMRQVRDNPELGPARCDEAGPWAAECRIGWARVRLGHADSTLEELLPACDVDEECLFDVLDAKPKTDFLAQLALCDEHLDATAPFCQQHAANRWLASKPDTDEQARVRSATGFNETRAKALGHLVACEGIGTCDGLAPGCEVVVGMLRETPSLCDAPAH
jgi:hypothetical protein